MKMPLVLTQVGVLHAHAILTLKEMELFVFLIQVKVIAVVFSPTGGICIIYCMWTHPGSKFFFLFPHHS